MWCIALLCIAQFSTSGIAKSQNAILLQRNLSHSLCLPHAPGLHASGEAFGEEIGEVEGLDFALGYFEGVFEADVTYCFAPCVVEDNAAA